MLGCGCLFALTAAFFPRLALLFTWIFTPLLGIIFLPFTTLMYVLAYIPGIGLTGWGWLWLTVGILLDLSSYAGSAYSNRNRIPGYSGT
jgi:hypothetical protein